MTRPSNFDAWSAGEAYECYMGRWSRRVAEAFLAWFAPPPDADWLEVGCGSGGLSEAILRRAAPRALTALDPSAGFVAHARARIGDPRVRFVVGDGQHLPQAAASVDVVTSGLVLNFLPDRPAGLREMRRVLRPGGLLSFYVWDYPGGGMGLIDAFWVAAATLDPAAAALDEGQRFPFCSRAGLQELCRDAGLGEVAVAALESATDFTDFEDFWHPFTLGAGPAPGYCRSLPPARRAALKRLLAERLGTGPIHLPARAWAVKTVLTGD